VGSLWEAYTVFIDDLLRTYHGLSVLNRGLEDPVFLVTVAVFAFLPQLLIALVGGLLGLSLGWSARSRRTVFTLFAIVGILVSSVAVQPGLRADRPSAALAGRPGRRDAGALRHVACGP